jgi:hypothetical protein
MHHVEFQQILVLGGKISSHLGTQVETHYERKREQEPGQALGMGEIK